MQSYKRNYKWQLDSSSHKAICPRCGKKTFVLYLDASKQPLSDDVGKCDRKDKCNWHYTPREFLRDQGLNYRAFHAGAFVKNPTYIPKIIEPDYIDKDDFAKTMKRGTDHSLGRYLHKVFSPLMSYDDINAVLMKLGVGYSKHFGGSPIFWQIDRFNRIRTGKVMGYNENTGKRVQFPKKEIKWAHKLFKDKSREFRLQQCYFGSHVLNHADPTPKPIISLFESEKAVCIVSLALAACGAENLMIPMSCGGCEALNPTPEKMRDQFDAISILKNAKVVLYPDKDKFEDWAMRGKRLKGYASEVYISTAMERELHPFKIQCEINSGDGFDDLILRYMESGKNIAELLAYSYGYRGRGLLV